MKIKPTLALFCLFGFLMNLWMPVSAQRQAPTPAKTPTQPTKTQATKTFPLVFDDLNDFVAKGLPDSGDLPKEGNLDQAAAIMAKQISRLDKDSLPMLLTALQTAGFAVVDENRKVLRKPLGDGKGQGLVFFDWETVGMLKLAKRGIGTTINKIVGVITKETPTISASQFSELMLKDLRIQADNSDNAFLRFWARLIIELGKSSAQPVDLMAASPKDVNLTMLQASLLIRRLQGDFYILKTRLKDNAEVRPPFAPQNSFVSVVWQKDDLPMFRPISFPVADDLPCNMTSDEALIFDASANGLSFGSGKLIELIGSTIKSPAGQATFGKLSNALTIAGLVLAWGKLAAAVTSLRGELTVENPLPLIRTPNSVPGERRLMKARIWTEVGRKQTLNCVRLAINIATSLDFNLPTEGPVSDTAVEWHFAGDNETRVNNSNTRNVEKFVLFESPGGKDRDPQKQVTDKDGISTMYLVGAPKIPAVVYFKAMTVEKKANVLVGVTLKSAKDFAQNWIDIGGTALTLISSPLGIPTAIAELGYRVPYVAARAEIPVTDHEPCDGQWQGTVSYTVIRTDKTRTEIPPTPNTGFRVSAGGYDSLDATRTLSGTMTVNSKYGHDSLTNSSVDEISILDTFRSGKLLCSPKRGWQDYSYRHTITATAQGNAQGNTTVYISLQKDNYTITITPLAVKTTAQRTDTSSAPGNCLGNGPSSDSSSSTQEYHGEEISGKASYGADKNILSGSDTTTKNYGSGTTVVTTITWNLRRCN